MDIVGEKATLKPYTLERCHEFYKEYISDPDMTYDFYVYNKEKVDRNYHNKVNKVLDAGRYNLVDVKTTLQ